MNKKVRSFTRETKYKKESHRNPMKMIISEIKMSLVVFNNRKEMKGKKNQ